MIASLNINWAYLCTRDLMYCAGDSNQISEYMNFTLHIFNYSSIYFVTAPETDPLLSKWRKRKVQHRQIDPSHPLTQPRCTTLWTSATARAPHSFSRSEYPHSILTSTNALRSNHTSQTLKIMILHFSIPAKLFHVVTNSCITFYTKIVIV